MNKQMQFAAVSGAEVAAGLLLLTFTQLPLRFSSIEDALASFRFWTFLLVLGACALVLAGLRWERKERYATKGYWVALCMLGVAIVAAGIQAVRLEWFAAPDDWMKQIFVRWCLVFCTVIYGRDGAGRLTLREWAVYPKALRRRVEKGHWGYFMEDWEIWKRCQQHRGIGCLCMAGIWVLAALWVQQPIYLFCITNMLFAPYYLSGHVWVYSGEKPKE